MVSAGFLLSNRNSISPAATFKMDTVPVLIDVLRQETHGFRRGRNAVSPFLMVYCGCEVDGQSETAN